VIEVGSAEASVSGLGVVKSYTNGESFGELALLHDSPRSATVTAVTDCTLWTLGLRYYSHFLILFRHHPIIITYCFFCVAELSERSQRCPALKK
jgi:CRP-like cAMP-binding protein